MSKHQYGGMCFKTKEKLENYIKFILRNQSVGTFLEGKYLDVMMDVLKNHENYESKAGKGSYKIGVRVCPINPRNRQFFILREDGTDTDFSYLKAIRPNSKATKVKKALRGLVSQQALDYKTKYFEDNADSRGYCVCPSTGLKIKYTNSHLDHYPTQFDQIVNDWCGLQGITLESIDLLPTEDNDTFAKLVDSGLTESFYNYHLDVAEYRVVLDKVNMQRGKWKPNKS